MTGIRPRRRADLNRFRYKPRRPKEIGLLRPFRSSLFLSLAEETTPLRLPRRLALGMGDGDGATAARRVAIIGPSVRSGDLRGSGRTGRGRVRRRDEREIGRAHV